MIPQTTKQKFMEAITLDGNFLVRHNNIFFAFLNKIINSCDIGYTAKIGKNLQIGHRGMGVVIGQGVRIGDNCFIGHHTTIGSIDGKDFPIIGNNVKINCNVVIVGKIRIKDNCIIGSGSYIDFDVEANEIVHPIQELEIRKRTAWNK